MKKLIAVLILSIFLIAGCQSEGNPDARVSAVKQQDSSEITAVGEPKTIPFVEGFVLDDVSEILYFDDSQPPGSPAATYTAVEEIAGVIKMLEGITLKQEITDDNLTTTAPGDFCGYEIHLKDGKIYKVWRSGDAISFEGKRYEYTGSIVRQLHIDEVVISAECSIGYPEDGKIVLTIRAFDEDNTTVIDAPVLKQFDGNRWNAVEPVKPGSGKRLTVADILPYIDLKNMYPQVITGDFTITYDVYLPSGEMTSVTAQFTIFE